VYTLAACACLISQLGLIIIVAASQTIFIIEMVRLRRRAAWAPIMASSAALGSCAAGVYWLVLRDMLAIKPATFTYLEPNYLGDVSPAGVLEHVWSNSLSLIRFADLNPVYLPDFDFLAQVHWLVFGAAVVLGALFLWRRRGPGRRAVLYALLPLGGAISLSAARLYPYGGVRQDLFLTPALYLLAAAGFIGVISQVALAGVWKWLVSAAVLAPLVLPIPLAWSLAVKGGNFRSAVEYLGANAVPGDAIYVYWAAAPAFHYYWENHEPGASPEGKLVVWGQPLFERSRRVWAGCSALLPGSTPVLDCSLESRCDPDQ
jgi:hypothetical protein